MGTPGPNISRKMGTWDTYYRENKDPGSPFSLKYVDPFVKMGTYCMADRIWRLSVWQTIITGM